jgi:hypothetical protein
MRNVLFASLALALVSLPGAAMALDTGADLTVTLDGEDVGTWNARDLVRDEGDQCRYMIMWSFGDEGTTLITKRCEILERKTTEYFSCHQENREENFPTSIEVGDQCEGFDSFGQLVNVEELDAAESTNGVAGAILLEGYDEYQSIEIG